MTGSWSFKQDSVGAYFLHWLPQKLSPWFSARELEVIIPTLPQLKTSCWHCFANLYQTSIKVSGTDFPCQLFSPDCLTRQLLKNKVAEENRTFCPCQDLMIPEPNPHFKVSSLTSGQGFGIKDVHLCASLPQLSHYSMPQATMVFMNSIRVRRKNKCLWAPQGWQKSVTDLPLKLSFE